MAKAEEKYFVCSGSDSPEKIFFDKLAALAAEYDYVDTFDEKGNWVYSYKRTESGTYSTDF